MHKTNFPEALHLLVPPHNLTFPEYQTYLLFPIKVHHILHHNQIQTRPLSSPPLLNISPAVIWQKWQPHPIFLIVLILVISSQASETNDYQYLNITYDPITPATSDWCIYFLIFLSPVPPHSFSTSITITAPSSPNIFYFRCF